jgi:hypothetical protein
MGMTDAQKIEKLQLEVFRQAVGLRLAMKAISSSKRAMKRQETLAVAIALIESMNIVEAVRQAQGARPEGSAEARRHQGLTPDDGEADDQADRRGERCSRRRLS